MPCELPLMRLRKPFDAVAKWFHLRSVLTGKDVQLAQELDAFSKLISRGYNSTEELKRVAFNRRSGNMKRELIITFCYFRRLFLGLRLAVSIAIRLA